MICSGLVLPITLKQTMLKHEHNKSIIDHLSRGILILAHKLKIILVIK